MLRQLAVHPTGLDTTRETLDVDGEGLDVLDVLSAEEREPGPERDIGSHPVRLERIAEEPAELPTPAVPVRKDDCLVVSRAESLDEVEHGDSRVQREDLARHAELSKRAEVPLPFDDHGGGAVLLDEVVDNPEQFLVNLRVIHVRARAIAGDGCGCAPVRNGPEASQRPSPAIAVIERGRPAIRIARVSGSPASNTARPMAASMADEEVNFERVTKVYREESSKKSLARLEPEFYGKLVAYLRGLETRATEEVGKAPNSPKAMLLQDELRKVGKKREQIFQYRMRKIAILAAAKASGGEADVAGLATPEVALFGGLVQILTRIREEAFGAEPPMTAARAPQLTSAAPKGVPSSPAFQRLAEPPKKIAPPAAKDLVVVHVLEDIPPFAGIDAMYRLRKEDVVTLPRAIAKVLIDRGKVRVIQTTPP